MNKLNVNAVCFWAFLFLVGYLVDDVRTGLIAMTVGLGLGILVSVAEG